MVTFRMYRDFLLSADVSVQIRAVSSTFSVTDYKHVLLVCCYIFSSIFLSYCINTTKYWLRAVFKENELASSPLILHKANILWY